ncbi:MAG: polysaccharide deacetylase family protein [Patescibacteria group bacterium]|nr:polysaccharide deacetylase family protein [Patescibacteria group bacterium]
MPYKKIFIVIGVLLVTGILVKYSFFNQKPRQTVKGASTTEPLAIVSSDEGITPQGKFYAPILVYHHIALKRPQNSYYVSPEIFDQQMKWLKDNGYHIISFDQFYAAALGKEKIPKKPIIITFDDGLEDQFKNAFPILKKYGFTATFFIKMNNLNKGGMTWDQLKELQKAGNIIGSHSVNHDDMSKMPENQLKYESEESKRLLEQNLGTEIKYFCYPGGAYSANTILAVKNAGYLAAVTTRHKVDQEIKDGNSIYTLPRVHIDDEMPTFIDWVQGKNLY